MPEHAPQGHARAADLVPQPFPINGGRKMPYTIVFRVFFSLQAQRSPNSEGQQPKTKGLPQTRARTGVPPTDARSKHSGKRQLRRQRLARTKEANATTHRRPHTARLPLAEPNTGRARDMRCTHEGTEAENGQSARGGTVQTGPHGQGFMSFRSAF